MLIEFRVSNFRSFRDEQVLTLVAGADDSLEGNTFDAGKFRLVRSAAVYGPNASGKSNLIKAIITMRKLVLESADDKPEAKLPLPPFALDDSKQKEPSSFEVTFIHEDVRYQYGFTASHEKIHDEWLFAYPKGNAQKWFERSADAKSVSGWDFGSHFKGDKKSIAEKTRENALFLSVGAKWNNEQLLKIYGWFNNKLRDLPSPTEANILPITAQMLTDPDIGDKSKNELKSFVKNFLHNADLGICDIETHKIERKIEDIDLPKDFPDDAREILIRRLEENPLVEVDFLHPSVNSKKAVRISKGEESSGTKRLFDLAGPWLHSVRSGITFFIDELEISLHPLLTRELIKFFQDPKINKTGAQLIFTTHDTTLLDPGLFRRDQIWFTEKDEIGQTHLYSMWDFKKSPRKNEAYQKRYLTGRYGAIPILESFGLK